MTQSPHPQQPQGFRPGQPIPQSPHPAAPHHVGPPQPTGPGGMYPAPTAPVQKKRNIWKFVVPAIILVLLVPIAVFGWWILHARANLQPKNYQPVASPPPAGAFLNPGYAKGTTPRTHPGNLVGIDEDGSYGVVEDRMLIVRDLAGNELRRLPEVQACGEPGAGAIVCISNITKEIFLLDWNSLDVIHRLDDFDNFRGLGRALEVDGDLVIAAPSQFMRFDRDRQLVWSNDLHGDIWSLGSDLDCSRLDETLVCADEGGIAVLDWASGEVLHSLKEELSFRTIATNDGALRVRRGISADHKVDVEFYDRDLTLGRTVRADLHTLAPGPLLGARYQAKEYLVSEDQAGRGLVVDETGRVIGAAAANLFTTIDGKGHKVDLVPVTVTADGTALLATNHIGDRATIHALPSMQVVATLPTPSLLTLTVRHGLVATNDSDSCTIFVPGS